MSFLSNSIVPKKMFFTKGVGIHKAELRSFELALRDAGIEKCNLVTVSSILPPGCQIIPRNEGIKQIQAGMVTFTVLARSSSSEAHRLVAASVGCAVPADTSSYGYLSEHHGFGQNEKVSGDYAEDLAAAMLASTLGLEFDEEKSWDENKQINHLSDKIVRTMNITQTAVIGSDGAFTTVIAAAVFLF
ncbi:MAG: arginine decarboxylase, pyruvoyl-dependent [Candidatus Omnitrophica bacterium]|nr:arginine decarboxylase, pyruvoyl-dependent [Candidatus Omnitrophota bacterium]